MKIQAKILQALFLLASLLLTMVGPAKVLAGDGGVTEVHTVFLPSVRSSALSISGTLLEKGKPAAGATVYLFGYTDENTDAKTVTDTQGKFNFYDLPNLDYDESYFICYQNEEMNANRLLFYCADEIYSFNHLTPLTLDSMEISDIGLSTPSDGAHVSLPTTFSWSPRTFSTSDWYEVDLFEPGYEGYIPVCWTDAFSYRSNITIGSISGCSAIQINTPVEWGMWVYAPVGGYGASFTTHTVYFNNYGSNANALAGDEEPAIQFRSLDTIPVDAKGRPLSPAELKK